MLAVIYEYKVNNKLYLYVSAITHLSWMYASSKRLWEYRIEPVAMEPPSYRVFTFIAVS